MPVPRFLQSHAWRTALLAGCWLALAAVALALTIHDPSPNLYHPSILLTARADAALWFLAAALMLTLRPNEWASEQMRFVRQVWTCGVAMHVVHVLFAFGLAHEWSHAHAFRRVEEVGGFGEGIFVSHAFAVVWLLDVAWWWANPIGYVRRPRWLRVAVHGFLAFVVFNATVMFGPPATRLVGAVAFGVLALLMCRRLR